MGEDQRRTENTGGESAGVHQAGDAWFRTAAGASAPGTKTGENVFHHTPVLLREVLEGLRIRPDGIYLDCTLGGGGHSEEIAKRLTDGMLIATDRDEDAVLAAGERLAPYGDKVRIVHESYERAVDVVHDAGRDGVNGILIDLGVSSAQLDTAERGFSYRYDAPLDMRMDRRQSLTARTIVNEWPVEELTRILREYGEERFAKRIAERVVETRQKKEIETTGELNDIIRASIPAKMRREGGHPSKRTFQAIRIACNRELEILSDTLDELIDLLYPCGRICVITFHSLEDRIVKNCFRNAQNPCVCPPDFPVCVCGRKPKGKIITGKPLLPDEAECRDNPRAKSAKLRIFERI